MAIPWLRRRSAIHGRRSPSGRSNRLISPSASGRGIGAMSAERRSGRAGNNGSASARAGATSVALRSMQGQNLVADSPAARRGGPVRSGKPSATTSPRTSATVLGIRLGDHGQAFGRTRKAGPRPMTGLVDEPLRLTRSLDPGRAATRRRERCLNSLPVGSAPARCTSRPPSP